MASPSLDEELEPGRVIERYEVKRLLGAGAMAAVYQVEHTTLHTAHALKVLTMGRGRKIKERMVQEGRNQARLEHPNIVRVFDVFHVDGMPALLMEYVDGPTLEAFLQEHPPTLAQAEFLFRGIVEGVREAHSAGLVHRDLKPANILILNTPDGPVPKVADFGLAKAWEDEDAVSHTRAGTAMGTPQYMAPEQALNAKDVDQRADVFALGCILYEMVCGRRAFEGQNLPTIYNLILSGTYPPPAELNPELPVRVRETIRGCLQTDPNARLPSCDAVLIALSGGMASADAPADRPDETPPRPQLREAAAPIPAETAPVQPQRKVFLAAALGLPVLIGGTLAVAIGLGALAWSLWPEGTEAETTPAEWVDGTCPGPRGQVVGWVWAGTAPGIAEGAVWTLEKDRNVRVEFPSETNGHDARSDVVCVLRKGTRLQIDAPVERQSKGAWVPVVAGSLNP